MIALLAAAVLLLAGCSSESEPAITTPVAASPSATATVDQEPAAAYLLERDAVSRLLEGDAFRTLEQEGRPIARSEWDAYEGVVLSEWLARRGISLEVPGAMQRVLERVAEEQELSVLVLTHEHRRYARRLDALGPRPGDLRRFYERFNEVEGDESAQAGESMLDWLRIFRLALTRVDRDHVVVIPVIQ